MSRWRRLIPLAFTGLLAVLSGAWIAAAQDGIQADPVKETFARSVLELEPGKEVTLRYRTVSWSSEGMQRMRQDAAVRADMNGRLQLGFQTEFTTPYAVSLQGRKIEAGTYRIGLAMNDYGAWEFTALLDNETVRFPLDLSESRQSFPYIALSVIPAQEALFGIVFQWGREYGRVLFARSG